MHWSYALTFCDIIMLPGHLYDLTSILKFDEWLLFLGEYIIQWNVHEIPLMCIRIE